MSSNRVSILYLTADNADADVVGSLVGIVREVQGGRSLESVAAQLEPARDEPAAPPLALPPKERKARKPRALKAAKSPSVPVAKSGRVNDAGPQLLAALRKNPRPDRRKLAASIYGDEGKAMKISQLLSYLTGNGKLKNNGDGTYTVSG